MNPSRKSVIALSVALNLSAQDTELLFTSAGYVFRLDDVMYVIKKAIGLLEDVSREGECGIRF